jgi:hypothetical protein
MSLVFPSQYVFPVIFYSIYIFLPFKLESLKAQNSSFDALGLAI